MHKLQSEALWLLVTGLVIKALNAPMLFNTVRVSERYGLNDCDWLGTTTNLLNGTGKERMTTNTHSLSLCCDSLYWHNLPD